MPKVLPLRRFPATNEALEETAAALRDLLDAQRVAGVPRYNVELAFEEIATNIIRHGSPSENVEVTVDFGPDEIVLTFEDNGPPFDPGEQPSRPAPTSISEAQLGGLGLVIVKKIASRLAYIRTPGCRNQLTVAIPAR